MPARTNDADLLLIDDEDLIFEEEILHHPYSVKSWVRYIDHKQKSENRSRWQVYERAVKQLPRSYKIWHRYLLERVAALQNHSPLDPVREEVNECFERALIYLNKMPRIWIEYLNFLAPQCQITRTRRAFDDCLRTLPITQHPRIWPLYLEFVQSHDIPETGVRVFRRYLMMDPDAAEEYIDYLISIHRLDEAAVMMAKTVNKDHFVSKKGKTRHQMWIDLCNLIAKNPDQVHSIKVEAIIRSGLRRFTDMVGMLWVALADYHIRRGNFEKARDVYEEAIQTVLTVRDFSQVFEAYAEFEQKCIETEMENATEVEQSRELELRMARFEYLMERRPLLLSSVLLRQNPHNVEEWHKRVKIFEGNLEEMVSTYTEAVQTVDPQEASGKPHTLWVSFAKIYEDNGQLGQARTVFEKGLLSPFRNVDDLATLWCEYAELEVRAKQYKRALQLMRRATAVIPVAKAKELNAAQAKVHKSLKIWTLYADLEESVGTLQSTKAVYNAMLDLKVATPRVILNFGAYLEEHKYFEEAFTAYERGVAMFRWPAVFEIWNTYLVKFVKRYGGSKLERARELFEQAVQGCTPKFARQLFLLYASFEEKHGLARHAMAVYERATSAVPPNERLELWKLYIERAASVFGVTSTRELYAKAIEALPDSEAREMCSRFADLERKLGEIDRARAIYSHGSQFADPRTQAGYWKTWHDFEVRHGNEDTYREMCRIKRSVAAAFNTSVNVAANMVAAARDQAAAAAAAAASATDMAALEAQTKEARTTQQFVRAGDEAAGGVNEDEIDLDDEDDDAMDEAEDDKVVVEQMAVPDAVFGDALGAKARFAAKNT